jgi:hypothetical protein
MMKIPFVSLLVLIAAASLASAEVKGKSLALLVLQQTPTTGIVFVVLRR